MKILNKLTKTDLKLNKKRTIGTLVGIILATALITVVGGMFYVFQNTIVEDTITTTGYYHISLYDISNEQVEKIKNNKDFSNVEVIKNKGHVSNSKEDNLSYYYDYSLLSISKDSYDYLKYGLESGTYPKNNNEILVDPGYIRENNLNIGDTVSLIFEDGTKKEYTIVGVTSRYGQIITAFDKSIDRNDVYLTLKHPKKYKKVFANLLEVDKYEKNVSSKLSYNTNDSLLRWEVFAFSDNVLRFLYAILGIVIGIILVTSVFSIRNSFAISVNEKIKTYGMLASIGATKKQIRKMVLLEGLYLGIIGIGLGLVLGNVITYLLTVILNTIASNANLINEGKFLYYKFSIIPTVIAVVVGSVMIYLSTLTSSIKAGRVSPIQNIKNSDNIKNPKKLRVPFYIRKIFKIGGVLSYKNLKRSKKKYRVTVISLTVSIFVFIVVSSFLQYGIKTIKDSYTTLNYDISVGNLEDNQVDANKLLSLGDSHASYVIKYNSDLDYQPNYSIYDVSHVVSDRVKNNICVNYDINGDCKEYKDYLQFDVTIYDDSSFKEYCKMIGINYEKIKDKAIIIDTYKENKKYVRYTNYKVNDNIEFASEDNTFTYEVGSITDIRPWGLELEYENTVRIVINEKYYRGNEELAIDRIYYETKNAKKIEDQIYEISDSVYVDNISEEASQLRTIVLIFSIFIYGFIIVVTFIGITSVFNTINSNMELRRREFASLKSIGMTKKEFNNMILLESVFYSFKSLTFGIILGIGGSYLVYQVFSKNVDFGYILPLKAIIISIVFIILLVYIIMKYSVSRLNKENIIETIRKENI